MNNGNLLRFLNDMRMAFRFLRGLPAYLRNPLTVEACRAILRHRLERRDVEFLHLVRRAVFGAHPSPYRLLMRSAGCEYGDLERLVGNDGLEGALQTLFRAGVYLTVDEYKGRKPLVRGSTTISVDPSRLRNPLSAPQFWAATSGSRGTATSIPFSLAGIRDRAVNMYLTLDARGGAHWRNAVSGAPGIGPLLWYSACGGPAAQWFSSADPGNQRLYSRDRWNAGAITWAGRLAGIPMPSAKRVYLNPAQHVARWLEKTLNAGDVPHLWTSPSSAVKVCEWAEKAGMNIDGARFTVTGEPVTETRLSVIRRVGGDAAPDYGSADSGGSVGGGCLAPETPDDVHVYSDLNAVIQADAPPFPSSSLLLSSIRPTVPFFFLNVSMGDQATISDRRCGCPMESLGWGTHLHTIRSYEKLTAGGVCFEDGDVIAILEAVLPSRFGGGPTDFQLVEGMAPGGRPKLTLRVHPALGSVDPDEVCEAFYEALGAGSRVKWNMAREWRRERFLSVERVPPHATPTGKILHLWKSQTGPSGDST